MSALWFEVTQIARGLLARPMFLGITVMTLALGIGANTAIFSAVDALLIRNLPFAEPDRLVMLWTDGQKRGFAEQDVANPGIMADWQRTMTTVASIAGINFWNPTLGRDEGAAMVTGAEVSWRLFETLGVQPRIGRAFTAEEDRPDGALVVVASHQFWQRELGGDPNVLGRTIELDREQWTIVGVMPKGFFTPTQPGAELYKPLQREPDPYGGFFLTVMARLNPGVSIEQADADLDSVQARLGTEYPDEWYDLSGYVQPLHEVLVQGVSRQLLVLLGATLFVLLIACANIANLLLARAIGRAREMALRAAIGASRRHIVRQVLIESNLLSLLGMVLGTVFAWYAIQWIASALPPGFAQTVTLGLDLRVLGFALAITLLTGLISGSIPAVIASRRDPGTALRDGERGSSGREGNRARALLVTGTFALALALTVSAGLFLKSLLRILDVDPGFRADGVLTFQISLPDAQYPDRDALRIAQDELQARLATVPGVTALGLTSTLPMGGFITDTGTAIEGIPLEGEPLRTWYSRVSPGYFAALGTPLLRGRDFVAEDRPDAPCVVIANETYFERYMGGGDAVGRRVIMNPRGEPINCEIVGLVSDLRFNTLDQPPDPTLYLPNGLFPNRLFFVVMRTEGDPASLLPGARDAVAAFDPGLAIFAPAPMSTLVDNSMRTPRLVAMLAGAFALLALTLAASGVYGVATYNVNAHMREFGVRTALGASQSDLLREVLAGGLKLVAGGMLLGVILTVAFGRLLGAMLYEVDPFDLEVFAAVAVLLIAAASLAMLIPARRAARVQPVEALRYE